MQSAKSSATKTSGGGALLNRHETWIYSGKTRENRAKWAQWSRGWGKQARLQVFTHTRPSFNTGHWTSAESPIFASTKVAFSLPALTQIFAAAFARTMAPAPFCQLHIAADHRDMQRPWINYFKGNSRTAAETFWTASNENKASRAGVTKKVEFRTMKVEASLSSRHYYDFSQNQAIREFL